MSGAHLLIELGHGAVNGLLHRRVITEDQHAGLDVQYLQGKEKQRINAQYIYSSTVLKYNSHILVLYLSISIFCYFILLFHYSLEGNIILFTPLDLIKLWLLYRFMTKI